MAKPIPLFDFAGYDTVGKDRQFWLNVRRHGPDFANRSSPNYLPYTVGGSDVATIFGVSPWKTNVELWLEKQGRYTPPEPSNQYRLWMGHQMEPVIANIWERVTGNKVVNDEHIYQHADFKWALADFDRRFVTSDGQEGILECKSVNWRDKYKWADGSYPYYYSLQLMYYLAVGDVEMGSFGAMWDWNSSANGFAHPFIKRNQKLEDDIFLALSEWIWSLEHDRQPKLRSSTTQQGLKALAQIYSKGNTDVDIVRLPERFDKILRQIILLQQKEKQLKMEQKTVSGELAALELQIREELQEAEHAILETSTDRILIDLATASRSTTKVNMERLEMLWPQAYLECVNQTTTYSRTMVIREEKK